MIVAIQYLASNSEPLKKSVASFPRPANIAPINPSKDWIIAVSDAVSHLKNIPATAIETSKPHANAGFCHTPALT